MSRFQDLSNNTYKPRTFNRDMSNNRFRPSNNRFKQQRSESRFGSNLPTNSRWKRDDQPREQRNHYNNGGGSWKNTNRCFGNRRPYHHNNLESQEVNSKFVDLKSMSRGFDVITTKPKQNKKKKKKKTQIVEEEQLNNNKQLNKNTNKYDLTKEEQDKLNELIVNQYNYEVIEESESEGDEEQEELE
jgi:hypothetical protein